MVALFFVRNATIVVRQGKVRFELDGYHVVSDGLIVRIAAMDIATIDVRISHVVGDGLVVRAKLIVGDATIVICRGIMGQEPEIPCSRRWLGRARPSHGRRGHGCSTHGHGYGLDLDSFCVVEND